MELEVLRGSFDVIGPVLITEPNQPFPICWDTAYFFGNTRVSTCSTIWMMLLLRSGDKAMISDAAAKATAIIAVVVGSMCSKYQRFNFRDAALKHATAFHDRPTVLYGLSAML